MAETIRPDQEVIENEIPRYHLINVKKQIDYIVKRLREECANSPIEGDDLVDLNFVHELLHNLKIEFDRTSEVSDPVEVERRNKIGEILEEYRSMIE